MIYPVILAGGKGERFWPFSNSKNPKQLLPLVTEKTMLEDTLRHISMLKTSAPIHIIASKHLEAPISRITGKRKDIILIGEPQGRDTAAAIALAGKLISASDPKGIMAVLTADHAISPSSKLIKAIKAAGRLAESGGTLVTFGIRPTRPEIGYGYIESSEKLKSLHGLDCFKVKQFHEKPDMPKAKRYCKSGRHFWNSGMFAWRVDYLWDLFKQHLPHTYRAFESAGTLKFGSRVFDKKLREIYSSIKGISIDFGIMEKAPDISMVVPDFSWDDIGSWTALDRLHKPDKHGNTLIGDAVGIDTVNTTCFSKSGMMATYGIKDLLVVQHNGVTLIVHKDKRAELKKLVQLVKQEKKLEQFL
ncbi:mannose-1-phosphate guanylyltransferase [Fibrobacterota bacterium]